MKTALTAVRYKGLRSQPTWRLLAADNGPFVMGFLRAHFTEEERRLPVSVLADRLSRDLTDARGEGIEMPQAAQHYLQAWVREGWLERHFPEGAREEEFEVSAAAATALRLIGSLSEPRRSTTESRLAVVIQQLTRLANDTDPNVTSRIASLRAEQERIAREITQLQMGNAPTLSKQKAIERSREIINLAFDLTSDFRQVREEFEQLNRGLRERLVDSEGSRGGTLELLFSGVDVIGESEAGQTFSAFWKLLTDPEQGAALEQAIDDVLARDFAKQLSVDDRRTLLHLTRTLLNQGTLVHDVLQTFARNLKNFVQSREFLEQRRLAQVLKEAQRAAVAVKDVVKATDTLEYELPLSTSRIRSLGQWSLYDPTTRAPANGMLESEPPFIDLETVQALVAQSEIDFRTLRDHLKELLDTRSQVSIGETLTEFPAEQGLGSVIGYLALGSRYGTQINTTEHVNWHGRDGHSRCARIPSIYFTQEKRHEL